MARVAAEPAFLVDSARVAGVDCVAIAAKGKPLGPLQAERTDMWGNMVQLLDERQRLSVDAAIEAEMDAIGRTRHQPLHVDGVEFVRITQGVYIYRLLLSRPVHIQVGQPLTFKAGGETAEDIHANVLSVEDQEVDVECDRPLPTDVRVLHAEFNPTFILEALRAFLANKNSCPGPLARVIACRIDTPGGDGCSARAIWSE